MQVQGTGLLLVSSFGAIDTAGFPKDSYYLFRSQWVDAEQEPSVHVLPGNWNQWKEGQPVEVWVNANVPSVELFLNGRSLGRRVVDPIDMVEWEVPYEPGELRAVAYRGDKEVATKMFHTAGAPMRSACA